MKSFPLMALAVVLLIVVPSLAAIAWLASSVKSAKGDFQKELENRLVSEEKLLKADNERAAFAAQVESLRSELARAKEETKSLKEEIKDLKDDVAGERAARLIAEEALAKTAKVQRSLEAASAQAQTTAAPQGI